MTPTRIAAPSGDSLHPKFLPTPYLSLWSSSSNSSMHSNSAVQEAPAAQPVATHKVAVAMGTSTLYGVLASVAQAGTRVFTVPIVIAHLGLDGYGIWSIIMTTGAYMRFGTAGLKSAFQKYVAEALGNGNFRRVNQLISTGSAAMLCASVLGLLPIAIFAEPWHGTRECRRALLIRRQGRLPCWPC